jgi:hypothetical protein|tara:strand:- start:31 stop:345 length:315 start_codon:yes stop_codon:yes gene_type:complete
MIKTVKVTLLVDVDTECDERCPSGNPLEENCVLNMVDNGDFLDPVSIFDTSYYDRDLIELNWSKDLTQDQYDHIKKDLLSGYAPEDLTQREIEEALEDYEEEEN